MKKLRNRRKFVRYSAPDSSLLLCNGRVGQIVDLSEGGMAIKLSSSRRPLTKENAGSFYCRSTIKEVDKLVLRIIRSDEIIENNFGNYSGQTVGVEFDYQDGPQHDRIRRHISEIS